MWTTREIVSHTPPVSYTYTHIYINTPICMCDNIHKSRCRTSQSLFHAHTFTPTYPPTPPHIHLGPSHTQCIHTTSHRCTHIHKISFMHTHACTHPPPPTHTHRLTCLAWCTVVTPTPGQQHIPSCQHPLQSMQHLSSTQSTPVINTINTCHQHNQYLSPTHHLSKA